MHCIVWVAVKKTTESRMLPMECQFLNRNALVSVAGQQPQPIKHFALKRKPKSAALRVELLQKCKLEITSIQA